MQPVPFLFGGVEERLDDDRAGMVEQHGHRPESMLDLGNRIGDFRSLGNIGHYEHGFAAGIDDVQNTGVRCFRIAVDDRDLRPFGGKQP